MCKSTMQPLTHLIPKVAPGGFVIVDDYLLAPCKTAAHDFLDGAGSAAEIVPIDGIGAYLRKA